jgi:tripartite-type tricarboxylate transporter receptor subunit TctC
MGHADQRTKVGEIGQFARLTGNAKVIQQGRKTMQRSLWLLLALVCFGGPVRALDYPTKPVRIIVGWAPGGIADVAARIVAHKLTEKWGQQVIVENRAGATGMIGAGVAARAPANGYTLMLAASPEVTTTPFIQKDAPRYFVDDFKPVVLVSINPMALVANADGPYQSVQALIDAAKKKPGVIPYSSSGVGSAPHLAGVLFEEATGIKLQHVPYKGGGPAAVAVGTGEVPVGFVAVPGAVPLVQAGRMKVLGLTTAHRIPSKPDWPTLAEAGVPNFDYTVWTGLFVQKGVPDAIVKKLNADFTAVLAQPDVIKQLDALGAIAANEPLAAFVERIKRDTRVNEAIVQKAHITNK